MWGCSQNVVALRPADGLDAIGKGVVSMDVAFSRQQHVVNANRDLFPPRKPCLA